MCRPWLSEHGWEVEWKRGPCHVGRAQWFFGRDPESGLRLGGRRSWVLVGRPPGFGFGEDPSEVPSAGFQEPLRAAGFSSAVSVSARHTAVQLPERQSGPSLIDGRTW